VRPRPPQPLKKGRGVHAPALPAYATLYSYDTHRGRVRPAWGHPNVIPESAPRYWQNVGLALLAVRRACCYVCRACGRRGEAFRAGGRGVAVVCDSAATLHS
jgi:hypothetical protein